MIASAMRSERRENFANHRDALLPKKLVLVSSSGKENDNIGNLETKKNPGNSGGSIAEKILVSSTEDMSNNSTERFEEKIFRKRCFIA